MINIIFKLPECVNIPLRCLKSKALSMFYYGKERFCPVCCRQSRRFRRGGLSSREDAQCFHCHALERHRFLWLYLSRSTNLFDGTPKKMLHVAPELCFVSLFKERLGNNYLTADLYDSRAMVKMDITNIEYPDQSFDVIYCSHVFEHVQDDKGAMREFYRVLKNNGWAILNVPICGENTFEDPSVVEPLERLKVFGQEDHVRIYGLDYVDRLRDTGFKVEVIKVHDLVKSKEAETMGLTPYSGDIYYCTKNN